MDIYFKELQGLKCSLMSQNADRAVISPLGGDLVTQSSVNINGHQHQQAWMG